MIQAAPLVLSFARAVPMLNKLVGAVGITELGNRVNNYIQENPDESAKIVSMIMPTQGIANALKNKSSEDVEEVEETEEVTTGSGVEERIREILREAGVEDADNQDLTDLPKDLEAKVMSGIAKSSTDRKKDMIEASAIIGLSGPGRERKKMIDDVSERYDEGGVEDAPNPKFDFTKFYKNRRRKADGGAIGIEVLFEEKKPRKNFFMGGPALEGPALGIYNSMSAYNSFTDQEIADAIKKAGYSLPTADSGTTPPDSTPGQGGGGGGGGGGTQNIIGSSIGGIGYSPSQNVTEFQAYKDKINAEAMGSPFTSGPMVDQMNDKIVDQMRSQNPNLNKYTNAEIVSMNPDMFNVGEVEEVSTFQKGISGLINSPFGKIAGFAINPALGAAKGILGMLPKSKPVGRVGGRNIYGVGSFNKFGTNAINQAALNKTGNFTNYQLGNMTDPGRIAGDPTKNVFAGMNAQSAFGNIATGAQKKIDTINANLAKGKYKNPAAKKAQVKEFQKQLDNHNAAAAKEAANKQAAKDNQAGVGGSCFIAGTKVTMADGTLKNIENVKVGDKVKGHKEENTVIKLDPTLLADRKLYSFNDNEHYFFTSEHPFMTEEGWKSIKPEKTKERDGVELYDQLKGKLKVGDKLVTDNGPIKVTDIKSKEMNNPEMPLYNFNVSNDNSYIADDYVVHNKGCFLKGTLITMADGTTKPVEQVDLGDEVAVGGKVFAVGRFLNTELYDYKGIKVSGSHMVNEDGTWMRVRDTKHGKSLGNDQNTVYVFGSENRRILINDILFTDYFEIEDQEQLLKEEDKFFDNWKTFANNEDQKNVNTLNAN